MSVRVKQPFDGQLAAHGDKPFTARAIDRRKKSAGHLRGTWGWLINHCRKRRRPV
jgi:hypothetical protein